MSTEKPQWLDIDPNLRVRLSVLAEREGTSIDALAERILRSHADQAEREITEAAEDERRWQRYLESGEVVPFDSVRGKLRHLSATAAAKVESQ